jgi:hypothetical protein
VGGDEAVNAVRVAHKQRRSQEHLVARNGKKSALFLVG